MWTSSSGHAGVTDTRFVLLTETNRNTAKYNQPGVSLWNNYQTLDNSDCSTVIPEKTGNEIERDDSYNHFAFTRRTEVEGVEPKQRMANLMSWKERSEYGEAEVVRICEAEYWSGESYGEK